MKIAIIGWGSLLWDRKEWFDSKHEEWQEGGPVLPIEFSRISRSRGNILTPVIDPRHGSQCPTAWCLSNREDFMDTICDIRQREGVLYKYINWIKFADNVHNCPFPEIELIISNWMASKYIDVTVWTGTQPNFQRITGNRFSIQTAFEYIQTSNMIANPKWIDYLSKLPSFVSTPFLEADLIN